ncbi:MAG: transposase, partial [Clostridia bacterium]|nr:transposase [Clostridia bacterium]
KMLAIGAIAEKYLRQMSAFYENVSVAKYVIMPNHIHFLIVVESGTSRTPSPTKQNSVVSRFVSTFKRFCNKEIGENVWQRSFNDHIIRNQEDFDKHWQYIDENPLRWRLDELYLSP